MKHTKNPWIIRTHDRLIYIAGDTGMICDNVKTIDDANLICAAPEMLKVLKVLREEILSQGPQGNIVNLRMIEEAIFKGEK